jgi:glutamine cyclotransferase
MKTVTVKYQDNEVPYLNELEYINGEVWANVWQTDCIARVSHEDGLVVGWIFLHELR